jgi:hypothetical protein
VNPSETLMKNTKYSSFHRLTAKFSRDISFVYSIAAVPPSFETPSTPFYNNKWTLSMTIPLLKKAFLIMAQDDEDQE